MSYKNPDIIRPFVVGTSMSITNSYVDVATNATENSILMIESIRIHNSSNNIATGGYELEITIGTKINHGGTFTSVYTDMMKFNLTQNDTIIPINKDTPLFLPYGGDIAVKVAYADGEFSADTTTVGLDVIVNGLSMENT